MRASSFRLATFSLLAFAISGCEAATDADSLNDNTPLPGGSGGSGAEPMAGSGPVAEGGSMQVGSAGSPPVTTGGSAPSMAGAATFGGSDVGVGGASGGSPSETAGSGPVGTAGSGVTPMGGSAGTDAMGGMPGTAGMVGTAGAAPMGGSGGTPPAMGPYDPRTGSFKMLAYSQTKGYRHEDSITSGKAMLAEIAKEQGFELKLTEDNSEITPEGLAKYEIVFFMNPTGDIFNAAQEKAFEDWIRANGAFAGVHSATDTESGWAFYKEVTGQYYDLHDRVIAGSIQWDSAATDFIAVKGLPSPWQRNEEWYKFNSAQTWTTKMGFKVLSRVTTAEGGTRPVSFIREWGNFRSFYTSIGHEGVAFRDANVKKHVAAGIMWAVRREALFR